MKFCVTTFYEVMRLPKATLAEVASWLIQKDTQDSMTIKMEGRYVWKMK